MGYCMSYQRLIHRNGLLDGYEVAAPEHPALYRLAMTAGDLRRMEHDQRDDRHLARYAALAGVTVEQVRTVLDAFLDVDCEGQTYT